MIMTPALSFVVALPEGTARAQQRMVRKVLSTVVEECHIHYCKQGGDGHAREAQMIAEHRTGEKREHLLDKVAISFKLADCKQPFPCLEVRFHLLSFFLCGE